MINIENAKVKLANYISECEANTTYNSSPIDMSSFVFSDKHGKSYNIATAAAYIGRYAATDGAKAGNQQDLLKAIHFLLFEVERNFKNNC